MKLLIYKYDELVQEAQLEAGALYTVGRQEDCDIVLEKFPGISRRHFEIGEETSGVWKINVLSKVKLLEFHGQEEEEFTLDDKDEFFLNPYRFAYQIHDSQDEESKNFSDASSSSRKSVQESGSDNSEEDFEGDQKTVIQNFDGVPYIKIIGQNRKKSEYFRLEGNLWVVGNDEDASVYLKETQCS